MADYDVSIEKKTEDKLFFNLSDGRGRATRVGGSFRMSQFPKLSIKMQQGDTYYSDREPPYASIEQRDFSGGRGWDKLERDRSRFYDSYRTQTWLDGVLMLGPRETYVSGIRDNEVNYWWDDNEDADDDMHRLTIEGERYVSHAFTPSTNITPDHVYLALGLDYANTIWVVVASIYSDDGAGKPDVELFTTESKKPTAYEMIHRFPFVTPIQLNAATKYHLVIQNSKKIPLSYASEGYYVMTSDDTAGGTTFYSDDLVTWTALDKGVFFRLTEDDDDFELFPFEHLGALYMAVSYKDGTDPKVFMNGERGTTTSSTSTVLTDSGAAWTVDALIGSILVLYSGLGADAKKNWRMITDNDGTTITVSPAFDVTPDETTKYVVVQSDIYTEVTGHGMTGRITDTTSYGNVVYFARGDFSSIFHMYDDTFAIEPGNHGTFIEAAPSSATGETLIYLARASFPPDVSSATPEYADDGVSINALDFEGAMFVGDASMGLDDGSWADYNGPATNARSAAVSYDGSWSRYIVGAAADRGATQTLADYVVGGHYHVEAWIYNTGANEGALQFDGTELDSTGTNDAWVYVHGYKVCSSASPTIRFITKGGANSFYFDAVKVTRIATPLPAGHNRITGLVISGEPRRLYILTDAGVLRENYEYLRDVSPGEFITARDTRNGSAQAKTGSDIYLSFLDQVCKYSDEKISIIGPNLEEGLPAERRGEIASMIMYGEWLLVAIDGGIDNTSSILLYNKLGWHEYYRAPAAGMRITKMFIQPMPEDKMDRLWFNEGGDIVWVGIDFSPSTNENYI